MAGFIVKQKEEFGGGGGRGFRYTEIYVLEMSSDGYDGSYTKRDRDQRA
jgi:hypothetical protein